MRFKFFLVFFSFTISSFFIKGQNPLSLKTQVEVGVGYVLPFFINGKELMRSKELRDNQQSYYIDESGNRKNVGNYSRSSGYSFAVGFCKPIKKVKGLMAGVIVRNAQTGSTPSNGGYEEAYFFNFITAGLAVKYYPFEKNNLFLKSDFGIAAVLTKNRYLNSENEQNFFHQFGIGNAFGFELCYDFMPFKNKLQLIALKIGYQLVNTRVEVNGIGDDNWQFGALSFGTSINFKNQCNENRKNAWTIVYYRSLRSAYPLHNFNNHI